MYNTCNVAITKNEDESRALLEGLDLIKADKLFTKDDIVMIVPNFVSANKPHPSSGITVGTHTLRTLIQWVKRLRVKKIIIACGAGGNTLDVMRKVGYDKIIEAESCEFVDFNTGPYVELAINHHIINKLQVNQVLFEKTKLISYTQLKQHEEATMSASIKNVMMSIPSTEEHGSPKKDKGIHRDLHGFIAKMAENIKIDLSIVSCNPAMVGTGPINGIPIHTGLVICGDNPICCDTVVARLLGFKPQAVYYLYLLEQLGYKETDINKMNIYGLKLKEAELIFAQKVYGENFTVD